MGKTIKYRAHLEQLSSEIQNSAYDLMSSSTPVANFCFAFSNFMMLVLVRKHYFLVQTTRAQRETFFSTATMGACASKITGKTFIQQSGN